jgi:ribosomal protein S12 methylthiotransferase
MDFMAAFKFDRAGVFPYSHEEDTPAFRQLKDGVPDKVKMSRADALMELQQEISLNLNQERIGKSYKVLIDRNEGDYCIGRTQYDSPEVDNEVLIAPDPHLQTGNFYQVQITGAEAFDLYGRVVGSTL